jgi:hypothetical protein
MKLLGKIEKVQKKDNARIDAASLGRFRGGNGRRNGVGKIANQKNELPALVVGELFAVRGHGFVAGGDDVKELAIGNFFEMRGVGEVGRARVIHFRLRAISLPCFAVTFSAFVEVN